MWRFVLLMVTGVGRLSWLERLERWWRICSFSDRR
ncbi:hypothetical protein Pint_33154 [Pistacia integerrima]|uniref:Uncharacterized protein n=1 Tax=Pistacia integerrima TaxID=434235 RepID=A0ACC0X8I9_9ROSI|nr:hypothetical protein Pint_33154 [Pistacia integerrima]